MVDYKIEVTAELAARYESALEGARRAGFEIVPAKDTPNDRRVAEYIDVMNDAFKHHWGFVPATPEEGAMLDAVSAFTGGYELSVIAYREGAPVGALFVTPDVSSGAILESGRKIAESEKLNMLGIGVREAARGRGVNLAMASDAFLHLIRKGAKYLSYTLMLDDNWLSRQTTEKPGARVCANYLAYRRNFRVCDPRLPRSWLFHSFRHRWIDRGTKPARNPLQTEAVGSIRELQSETKTILLITD